MEQQQKYQLPIQSVEQQIIIDNLLQNNLLIQSVAGSGKTTTILHIANKYKQLKFLLLTYNAKLKIESRLKVQQLNLNNIEVHSFHSFCYKYYDDKCITDKQIEKILLLYQQNKLQTKKQYDYDVIIIDECQDMTPLYYQLVYLIYQQQIQNKNKNQQLQICLLGDGQQSIFQFNLSDQRFLQYGDKLFNFNNINWKICHLKESFRITLNMSQFINQCVLGYDKMISNKKDLKYPIQKQKRENKQDKEFRENYGKVQYFILNSFKCNKLYDNIVQYLKLGYKLQDFFILSPSVKSQSSPVRQLANYLTENKINIYVPISDEEKLDEQILQDKIVFSTFHQVKGLERKIVIIYNFDISYYQMYSKNEDINKCPNTIYVAITRAQEHLILIHDYKNDFLPFLNINKLRQSNYVYIHENKKEKLQDDYNNKINNDNIFPQSVSQFIKFLPNTIINESQQQLQIQTLQIPQQLINIEYKTLQQFGYENVCDINGIAIPAYHELQKNKQMTILQKIQQNSNDNKILGYNSNNIQCQDLLFIANKWQQLSSGYDFKIQQIQNYDWLNQQQLDECYKNVLLLDININSEYEKQIKYMMPSKDQIIGFHLNGFVDCIDNENKIVYEFKCKVKLDDTDILQLAVYQYLLMINDKKYENYKYILYNILSKEKIQIDANLQQLLQMIQIIQRYKKLNHKDVNDEQFIKNILQIINKKQQI